FLIFYLVAGLIATFAQYSVNPSSSVPNVGASGAIAGVLAAYLIMFPQARVNVLLGRSVVAMPAFIVLGLSLVLQVVTRVRGIVNSTQTGDTGGVGYMAHVGGFVGGVVLTFLMGGMRKPDPGA